MCVTTNQSISSQLGFFLQCQSVFFTLNLTSYYGLDLLPGAAQPNTFKRVLELDLGFCFSNFTDLAYKSRP